jgi:glycosyltransferase involved in cell wall biosynthesis
MEYGDTIRLISLETNGGACAARNRGAALAGGDYLVFLDGDDRLLPWALDVYDRIVSLKSPKIILCRMLHFVGSYSTVDAGSWPIDINMTDYEAFIKKDRPYRASASAMVIERQAFWSVGGFSEDLFPLEDADIMLKLGTAGRTINIQSPRTSAYRIHGNNFSRNIPRLIAGVHVMIKREKSGVYPGGSSLRIERHSVLGGIVFFWVRETLRKGLYREAFGLLSAGWLMIISAIFSRAAAFIRGRMPIEVLGMGSVDSSTQIRTGG